MSEKMNFKVFLLLLLSAVIFFSPVLFSSQTFFYSDTTYLFRPFKSFIAEGLKHFSIPQWNPFFEGGMPLLSDPVQQVFYPLNLILMAGPLWFTYKIFIIFHYVLAGFFMYLLASKLGLKQISALFSAAAYMFSGYLIFIHYNLPFLAGATYLPLFFYSLIAVTERLQLIIPCSMLAFSMSMQLFGGDIEIVYVELIIAFIYLLITGLRSKGKSSAASTSGNLSKFFITVLLLICFSAIIIFPLFYLYPHTNRAARMTSGDIYLFSFQPLQVCELLIPYFYGNITEGTRFIGDFFPNVLTKDKAEWAPYIYCGTITLFFLIFGLLTGKKKKEEWFFLSLFIFFLAASFGKDFILYPLLVRILPFFAVFRYPAKLMAFVVCSMAALGGIGFDKWAQQEDSPDKNLSDRKYLRTSAVILLLIPIPFVLKVAFSSLGTFGGERINLIINSSVIFLFMLALTFITGSLVLQGRMQKERASFIFILILLIDLWIPGLKSYFTLNEDFYRLKPLALSKIELLSNNADKNSYRILRPDTFVAGINYTELKDLTIEEKSIIFKRNTLKPACGVEYGVQFAGAYSSYSLSDMSRLEKELNGTTTGMNLLNIRYIIAPSSNVEKSPYPLIYKHPFGEFVIFENPEFLPRAFLVNRAHYFDDREKMLVYMKSSGFSPRDEVLLEGEKEELTALSHSSPQSETSAIINKYMTDRIDITTTSENASFLLLCDTWFPGWSAVVDGKETEILRADYCFRALSLPAGRHEVTMKFSHPGFKWGAVTTGISFLIFLFFLIIKRKALN